MPVRACAFNHILWLADPGKGFSGLSERKKLKINKICSRVHVGGKKKFKWVNDDMSDKFKSNKF